MITSIYDRTTIAFHWLSAAIIALLWVIGQTADAFPKGPIRDAVWSTHFSLGALLAVLWILRIVWRATGGKRLPEIGSPLMAKATAAGHGLLYLLIAVAIGLGVSSAMSRGSSVFGLFSYPKLIDESLRHEITEWHELAANALLILAGLHALIALAHQYVWKDGTLTRMVPRLARSA